MILAYLDPGAGSLVIQAIIAGALAIPFLLRTHIQTLLSRARRRTAADPDGGAKDPSE